MKVLKRILLILAAIIVLLVIVSFFLPSSYSITRTTVMKAPPEAVFDQFNDFNNWRQWNTFDDMYKEIQYTTSDPSSGVGAKQSWVANKNEKGEMTIVKSEPPKTMEFTIAFEGFDEPMYGYVNFEAVPEGTKVTWTDKGSMGNNPLYKYMGLFMENMMGGNMEKSFDNIRRVVEK
ncbi:SRPBCC family protein [Chitinophaga sp.]|uniref:SRPBCC family protein n=1 Tax=Chitinophaga sp. TaxID=1869181 RepID=UPI0031D67C1E